MSHEQALITKKCVAMHTNYLLNVKIVLYCFNALVMKLLTIVEVVKAKIITIKLKANFHLNMSLHIHPTHLC